MITSTELYNLIMAFNDIGLKAKFKGIKEKKPATAAVKTKKVAQVKKPLVKRKSKPKKPAAPIKAPMNIDGNSPMRRKKKPEQE